MLRPLTGTGCEKENDYSISTKKPEALISRADALNTEITLQGIITDFLELITQFAEHFRTQTALDHLFRILQMFFFDCHWDQPDTLRG